MIIKIIACKYYIINLNNSKIHDISNQIHLVYPVIKICSYFIIHLIKFLIE